jgi:poly-gamma-glutamate capsule biosynthesis protein CapA/YwtB (metallophosphatase superfamily)
MRRFCPLLGLLASLSFPLAALDLRVADGLQPSWDRFVSANPLPPGITSGAVIVQDRALPGFRVVEQIVTVPVATFWDAPPSVTRILAESGSLRLVPMESVQLPDIAVPVDGLLPGDPGYPLVRDLAVGIEGDDHSLVAWFESLPAPAFQRRITWIGAVGDLMPARGVDADLQAPEGEQHVFGDTLPVLQGLDVLVGNLEAVATAGGARKAKTYTFRFDPGALARFASAGFSYLSVANNHTFDYGKEGFIDTLANLARAGIATSGSGRTVEEAARPAVLHVNGEEVRLLSFGDYPVDRTGFDGRTMARAGENTPGSLWLDEEGLAAAAHGFSRRAFNIALVHGGVEWSSTPSAEQRRRYSELIRAGADLVIGSHPHVLQGMEARDGKLIAYSMGNFLFPGMEGTPGGESSAILQIGILDGRIVSLHVVPVRLHGGTVRLDQREKIADTLRSLTRNLSSPPAPRVP